MRKTVIILLTILLIWNVGLTQNNNNRTNNSDDKSPRNNTENLKKDNKTNKVNNPSIKVVGVTVNKKTLTLSEGGQPEQLKVTINPLNATNKNVNWRTKSQGRIASVSGKGEVTPVKSGLDTIIVISTDGNKMDSCIVTINAVVDSLVLFKSQVSKIKADNEVLEQRITDLTKKQNKIPDYISYFLVALVVFLGLLLFLLNKKKNEIISDLMDRKEFHKSNYYRIKEEIGYLHDNKNKNSSETERLKDENQKLRAEIYLYQQKQSSSTSIKEQPETSIKKQPETSSQQQIKLQPQPQFLYADAIVNGKFNRVKEQPDDDTIFQLELMKEGDLQAKVIIYESAYRRIIARPSFLDGCEKQILGNSTVTMLREGSATKDESGKWTLSIIPEVRIS